MQTENLDLLEAQRKQRGQIMKFIVNYCRKHRMRPYDLLELSQEALDEIACEVVDLFEDRFLQFCKKTPPRVGASYDVANPGSRGRSRG